MTKSKSWDYLACRLIEILKSYKEYQGDRGIPFEIFGAGSIKVKVEDIRKYAKEQFDAVKDIMDKEE